MSISETIWAVAKSLRGGGAPNIIKLAIMSDSGCSEARALTIIGWARTINASRTPNQSAGSCL